MPPTCERERARRQRLRGRTRGAEIQLASALLIICALGEGALVWASSSDAASRDPQGRGLQLLAERESILNRQERQAALRARTRGRALYRLMLSAKAERGPAVGDGAEGHPGGRAISIGAAVLARDLREDRLFRDELERVRAERRLVGGTAGGAPSVGAQPVGSSSGDAALTPGSSIETPSVPDPAATFAVPSPADDASAGGARVPVARFLRPVAGRLVSGFGVARDEPTRAWLFRTAAAFSARAGERVRAPAEGRVVRVADDVAGGAAVVMAHAGGIRTIVSGLGTVNVAEGALVSRGAPLGAASSLPSLIRLEVWRGRQAIDPAAVLMHDRP